MKLDQHTKDKIDKFFDNISQEELEYIKSKYIGKRECPNCGALYTPGMQCEKCGFIAKR